MLPNNPDTLADSSNRYEINIDLYQSSLELRDQMNLIAERIQKMDEHKSSVSGSVYQRVRADYSSKLETIKKSFESKKKEIVRELEKFYKFKIDLESELKKHQEVLEEAKFRNFLGEYNEEQFQSTQNIEQIEIEKLSQQLSYVESNINQYEELVGGPVHDLIAGKNTAPPPSIKTPPSPSIQTESQTVKAFEPVRDTQKEATDFELPIENILETESQKSKTNIENKKDISESTSNYFDDSISDILSSIPVDETEEEVEKIIPKAKTETSTNNARQKVNPKAFEEHNTPPMGTSIEDVESGSVIKVAKFKCLEGDLNPPEYELRENTSIGRSPSNDIVLKEAKVSRQHAAINLIDGQYVLVDLKSSNGVIVNGKKIEEHHLQDGDVVGVGSYQFCFRLE